MVTKYFYKNKEIKDVPKYHLVAIQPEYRGFYDYEIDGSLALKFSCFYKNSSYKIGLSQEIAIIVDLFIHRNIWSIY